MVRSFRYVTDYFLYQSIDVFSPFRETLDPLIKVTRMGQPLAADDMHREWMVRIPDVTPECPYAEAAVVSCAPKIQPAAHCFGIPDV
jgi:hypothetical protein